MAKSTKNEIKNLIAQEIKNLENGDDEKDEEYQPRFIESPTKIDAEERVIDELLASVPKNSGYYLKLSKEIRPNEFELKLRVDNYDAWSDLEWEITNLVRSYTLKSPHKWGSGHYRVIIWREGGVRGPKFKPIDFYIDAQEDINMNMTNTNVNSNVNVSADVQEKVKEQFASFSELIKTLQVLNPTASPADIQGKIFDAFKSGLDAKTQSMQVDTAKDVANQSQMTAILLELIRQNNKPVSPPPTNDTLIAQLIQALTAKNQIQSVEKDPLDMLIKLREAGILTPPVQPVDSVTKAFEIINTMLPMMQGLSGGGTGDSTISTIIKTVGPQISKIIGDVTGTINKAIDAKLTVNKNISSMSTHSELLRHESNILSNSNENLDENVYGEIPISPYDNVDIPLNEPVNIQPNVPPQQNVNASGGNGMEYIKFLNGLKKAIHVNDPNFFPSLEDALMSVTSEENYDKLVSGETPVELAAQQIVKFGGAYFGSPQALKYYNSFVQWARNQKASEYAIKCQNCQEDNVYASQEYFNTLTSESEDAHCINCNTSLLATSGV